MATQPEEDELVLDTPEVDQEDDQQGDQQEQQDEPEDEEEILIGDDTLPRETDSDLIKHLRGEIKRRDSLLAERPAPQPQRVEIGKKPDLWEDCDGDPDKFEAELTAWHDRKRQAEQAETEQEAGQRKAAEEFQGAVTRFEAKKAELKVSGAPEAIDTAVASFGMAQRAAVILAADNAALVFAALGKHPAKLAEIAAIEHPVKLAAAIAKFEGTLKVGKRTAPPPEDVATGSAKVTQERGDKQEERLVKEADRTGNRTALIAYRKQKQAREQGKK